MDKRFENSNVDPRFIELSHKKRKIKVDKRFKRMFTDKSFKTTHQMDKFGRKNAVSKTEDPTPMQNYVLSDSDTVDDNNNKTEKKSKIDKIDRLSLKLSENGENPIKKAKTKKAKTKKAKTKKAKIGKESIEIKENENDLKSLYTPRLALVKQDWSVLRAVDIYVMVASFFKSEEEANERIKIVSVCPTKYGEEMIKKESAEGPGSLFRPSDNELDEKLLREYEENKLNYYYAIIECDSVETAKFLYDECNGVRFGKCDHLIDLQYIPDEKTIEKGKIRDSADCIADDYRVPDFNGNLLYNTKLKFSWDMTDPLRSTVLANAITKSENIKMEDFEQFLGSTDTEERNESDFAVSENDLENGEKCVFKRKKRQRILPLLEEIRAENNVERDELQIQFKTTLTDEKADLGKIMDSAGDAGRIGVKKGFNLVKEKRIRKKMNKKDAKAQNPPTQDFQIDINDDRFKPLLIQKNFTIDPSNPLYKDTESMKTLLNKISDFKKTGFSEPKDENAVAAGAAPDDLSGLLRSVKRKLGISKKD